MKKNKEKEPRVIKCSPPWGVIIPLAVTILTFLLMRFVLLFGYVPTESMVPTIKKDSFFLACRVYDDYKVGDVAVFKFEDRYLVKRVAATGGDTIERNGVEYTVPDGCYFMLGDNADNSYDSRFWENPYISQDDMIAVVFFPSMRQQSS